MLLEGLVLVAKDPLCRFAEHHCLWTIPRQVVLPKHSTSAESPNVDFLEPETAHHSQFPSNQGAPNLQRRIPEPNHSRCPNLDAAD